MYICIYTNCDVIYTIHVTLCLLSNMVCDIDILNNGKKNNKFQVKANEHDLEAELLFINSVPVPYSGENRRNFYKCNKNRPLVTRNYCKSFS